MTPQDKARQDLKEFRAKHKDILPKKALAKIHDIDYILSKDDEIKFYEKDDKNV